MCLYQLKSLETDFLNNIFLKCKGTKLDFTIKMMSNELDEENGTPFCHTQREKAKCIVMSIKWLCVYKIDAAMSELNAYTVACDNM